jgi:glycosyltransferase involved in cell wall biosynthesis
MSSKPRILFAGPMLGCHPGWVPSPAELLASRLSALGYSSLLTSKDLRRFVRFREILQTILFKKNDYDILCLQVYSGPSFVVEDAASWLAHKIGKPIIMVLHGGGIPAFAQRYPNWMRRVLQRATRIVTPSGFLARVCKEYGYPSLVIPNAIDLGEYPYIYRQDQLPGLIWMRTLHPLYNPEMAVHVLELVRREIPNAFLTMYGQEKGGLAATRLLVEQKRLADAVHFEGFLSPSNKASEFSRHQIFLNTNRVDNMPVSVIEAAAFGLPVISTNVGGLIDMISHEVNGLLVPNEDASAMANAVIRLFKDPTFAQGLSGRSRLWAEQFDWSRVLVSWDRLFSEIGC